MSGPVDELDELLAALDPSLDDEVLVYVSLGDDEAASLDLATLAAAWLVARETEGTTLVLPRAAADAAELDHTFACRRIELRVHSALEAVGLTAAVSTALAGAGIPANVVAAYHHDHVLVPEADADHALDVLRRLARAAGGPMT